MGETQSRPTTKGRRSSTGETNVLIPPPSRLALTSSSKIIVEIDIAFLVSSYAAYDLYALSSTCKQFQSVTNCVKIFQCIHKSDVKRLRRLLRHTTANTVSFKDPCNGRNAFHVAATSGHPEILELLLEFYPKLHDLPDKFDLTPLHLASIRGSKSMVRTLLEKGADPNKADWNGHTSLHFTTFAESKIIADELIRHGADVNTKSKKDGSTPAHFVCLRCVQSAPALLSLLEASGANLKELNCSDQTPLHVAAFSNNVRAIEFLLENYSDTCVLRDRCGRTPFMYSVASGCVDTSTQILNANQGVLNMIDGNGMTALHVACQRNSRDHVSMLLNRGADVNIADNLGVTPLHVACHDHDADEVVIGELIRSGSRLDVCDSHGLTPLHIMCARGRYDLIRDIIFHVDTKTLSSSSSESTILLPRERARRSFQILTNCDSKKLFQSADDKGWNVSHFVSSSNNIELLGLLIDAGCDVNRKAKDGVTPLHIASTKSVAMVHLLLASGSKPKQRANGGITPIHIASANEHIRKMLTTKLSPGGKSIRILDRSWSRRLIESETSKSLRVFPQFGWKTLFGGIHNRRRQSDSRALALVTHFKMYLRRLGRQLTKRREEDSEFAMSIVPNSICKRVRVHFSMVLNDTQLFVLGERLAVFVMMFRKLYQNNMSSMTLRNLSSEIARVSKLFSDFVHKAYPQMSSCDDIHGTLCTIVDTELERGVFRGVVDVLMRKLQESSIHSETNSKTIEHVRRLNVRSDACLRLFEDDRHILMKALGLCGQNSSDKNNDNIVVASLTSKLRSSILRLGEIHVNRTPRAMLRCISDTCRLVTQVFSDESTVTSDTLIPVLAFVIVRAELESAYLDSVFVDLYMPESLRLGEAGFTLVTFQTALNYIRSVGDKMSKNQSD